MKVTGVAARYDSDSLTQEIVQKIADLEGVEPLDLETPLYEAIDPEALEALLTDTITGERRDNVSVEFQYYGYDIVVDSDGEIAILTG